MNSHCYTECMRIKSVLVTHVITICPYGYSWLYKVPDLQIMFKTENEKIK
jgi:hypothetical protein